MNMIKAFNKATKKFSDYFTYIEKELVKPSQTIESHLTYFNSQLILWNYDEEYSDEEYESLFIKRFNSNYRIYSFTTRQIAMVHKENIQVNQINSELPIFPFEYLISFLMKARAYLKANEYNVLILHDELLSTKIFLLISLLLMYVQDKHPNPIDLYKDLEAFNTSFASLITKTDLEFNSMRYMSYFNQITTNPIINIKQLHLKYIIINGSPAIENKQNPLSGPYLTIDDNSFYSPIIRLKANGKSVYCSYDKAKPVHQVMYSEDSVAKFDVNGALFGDIVIDVLHKGEGKFRLLFSIQFNTFFIEESCVRFEKKDIDGVHKDIRYPKTFGVDLMFDWGLEKTLSAYEEESVKWKTLISDFIVKGKFSKANRGGISIENSTNATSSVKHEDEVNEDLSTSQSANTMTQVQELLEKMHKEDEVKKGTKQSEKDKEDEEEEDIDDYIQNLEKKAK